jgi:membrane-associated tyrosine/threonine-specific cdc2-inhibitory kinase
MYTCSFPFTDPDIASTEDLFGDYPDYFEEHFIVIEKLGSGSFADAFKVQFRDDGKLYALKRTRQPYMGHKDR